MITSLFLCVCAAHFRSQTDNEGNVTAEPSTGGVSVTMDSAPYTKTGQPILEDLSGRTQKTVHLVILLKACKGIKAGLNAVAATLPSATGFLMSMFLLGLHFGNSSQTVPEHLQNAQNLTNMA